MEDLLVISRVVQKIVGDSVEKSNLEDFIPPDGLLHMPVDDFRTLIADVIAIRDAGVNIYNYYCDFGKLIDVNFTHRVEVIVEFCGYFDVLDEIIQKLNLEKDLEFIFNSFDSVFNSDTYKFPRYLKPWCDSEGLNYVLELCVKFNDELGFRTLRPYVFCPLDACVAYNKLDFLKIYGKDATIDYYLIKVAIENNSFECFKWLIKKSDKSDSRICWNAANHGHLEYLKYAHAPDGDPSRGCSWDKSTCEWAAINGDLECLKYAHAPPVGDGCPWDEMTCTYAAQYGHLDCLEYAHTHGCPWNKFTCAYAAQNGHLECLKYAHTHGCRWDTSVYKIAAESTFPECFKYVRAPPVGDGCPQTLVYNFSSLEIFKIYIEDNNITNLGVYLKNTKNREIHKYILARMALT